MTAVTSRLSTASAERVGMKGSGRQFGGPTTRYRAGSLVGFETCSPVMDPAMKELEIQGHSTCALV
jgi:hypothetical protein